MSRVNLLPWRRGQRQRRQKEFLMTLGAGVLGAALLVIVAELVSTTIVNRQEERNALLRTEIAALDIKIREIRDIQAQKSRLQARMDVIQDLQVKRPMSVKLFDALARSVPDGVFVARVSQRETALSLQGLAQSNARVSTFMHQLDASDHFDPSTLGVARATEHRGMHASQYDIKVPQHVAKDEPGQ